MVILLSFKILEIVKYIWVGNETRILYGTEVLFMFVFIIICCLILFAVVIDTSNSVREDIKNDYDE